MMKKRIVVFGGAFNPPTNGHLSLAENLIQMEGVDGVMFLPVGDTYPKKGLLPSPDRVRMLELIVEENPKFMLSTVEVDSPVLLNTIDSLRLIQRDFPDYELAFLMGTDNLAQMPNWDGAVELLSEFSLYVTSRNEEDVEKTWRREPLLRLFAPKIHPVTNLVRNDISSTLVRNMILEGRSIRYLVPDVIHNHLVNKRMYQH